MGARKKVIDPATVEYLPCSACKETKHRSEFHASKKAVGRGGRNHTCKACGNDAKRAARADARAGTQAEPQHMGHGLAMSRSEVAQALGIAYETVRAIERSGLKKLRAGFRAKGIDAEEFWSLGGVELDDVFDTGQKHRALGWNLEARCHG